MGQLLDEAKKRSQFIRLNIGEKTSPLTYKAWKSITNNFGNDSFRYFFEETTDTGIIVKSLDVPALAFAAKMDAIPFGREVVITRKPKIDPQGNFVEKKSVYDVEIVA